jgi:HD-like signal output (HDOD) protein
LAEPIEARQEFRKLVGRMKGLPSISTSVARVLSILDNPASSARELGDALSMDQSLASRLLKMVNSAYFGFPRRIDTLHQAVAILGFRTIHEMVLVTSIFEQMDRSSKSSGLDRRRFWQHAVGCALSVKALAEVTGVMKGESVFLAGLLHDIGKVILDAYLHDEYAVVLETARGEGILLLEAEQRILGANHTDFGHWLAEEWNLPATLAAGVIHHHRPAESRDHYLLACLVNVADVLVQALDYGHGGSDLLPAIAPEAWSALNLSPSRIERVIELFEASLPGADAAFAP